MGCTKGFAERFFCSGLRQDSFHSNVIVKQFRLVGDAEESHSLLTCAAVFLHDPAEVACPFSWPESRDTDFLYLDISLGHGHAGINVRYFTAIMGITDVLEATRKEHPAFSKEHLESWD